MAAFGNSCFLIAETGEIFSYETTSENEISNLVQILYPQNISFPIDLAK